MWQRKDLKCSNIPQNVRTVVLGIKVKLALKLLHLKSMIENSQGSERTSTDTLFDEERKLSHEGKMCNFPTANLQLVY